MEAVALGCATLLAVVFAVSGAAKALDRRGTREAVGALGVAPALAPAVAVLLPPVELALAVLVLPSPTGRPAAVAAGVLLTAFTLVVLSNLARGRRPACGCFGSLGSSEVSWQTVARNVVLLAAAAGAATGRGEVTVAPVLAGAAVAGLLLGAERWAAAPDQPAVPGRAVVVRRAPEQPYTGPLTAPSFSLPAVSGGQVALDDLRAQGKPVLLVFMSLSCASCTALLPRVVRWHDAFADRLTVVALVDGPVEQVRAALPPGTTAPVLRSSLDVTGAYRIRGVPSAALVGLDGVVDGEVVGGDVDVHALLAQALHVAASPAPRVAGPAVTAGDLARRDPAGPGRLHPARRRGVRRLAVARPARHAGLGLPRRRQHRPGRRGRPGRDLRGRPRRRRRGRPRRRPRLRRGRAPDRTPGTTGRGSDHGNGGARVKVVVTGGAGFIGANLCRRLAATPGVAEVVALDDLSSGDKANLDGVAASLVLGSVLDDDVLDEVVDGATAVVHLAAVPSVPRSIADPLRSHEANATGTLRVLEAARRAGSRPQVVVASSSSVYGANPAIPKVESLRPMPMSPYAVSKLATECYALSHGQVYGMDTLAFRFFNVFGPLQAAGHAYAAVVPAFVDAALQGRPLVVHGDGRQTRDFTFVDTVTAVLTQAVVGRTSSPEPVNLAYGTRTSLLELIGLLEDVLVQHVVVQHVEPRAGDVRDSQADSSRLADLFPQVEPVALRSGLQATVDWFRAAGS